MTLPDDAITLQAFSLARLQLNGTLPAELQQAIHQLGDAIANHEPGVAERVRTLVEQNPCFRGRYEEAYKRLQQHYQNQSQGRVNTLSLVTRSESIRVSWEGLVVKLLTADDPQTIAQQVFKVRRSRPDLRQLSDIPPAFLTSLQQELADLDCKELTVLKALERQLLTVEDLAYGVDMPIDDARIVLQSLWNKGYIDVKRNGLLDRIASLFKSNTDHQPVTDSTSFNLTAKGHYRLHPLVTARRREGNFE
ncbi:hypothetical protein IQ268_24235 [Oculatella sp. LEGE 06141]|uniref:hypothetical protein n=1 Tax=Oculatella sp. LEGE 06141 TaxID=1828648 RepID=UPI00187FC57B|nr:hypothetical protein [Oculatella sp. LEGE 06141]MBE9181678.1 hypothetical protein [Oculatella sp. LEGE 06141]